ncbi:MAG: GNAT family N-acetyltransferase [Anaerolineales bacterium]|nr:GNAT family N-acetyltransferase [Anaerolineales bacterium]
MTLTVQPVTERLLDDLAQLFGTNEVTERCWCMWFIIPVKQFHAQGSAGNCAQFGALAAADAQPMGLLAYQDGEPVGWCAAGPRSRYVRALKTPTYRGGPPEDDDAVWLVPCFFVRPEARGAGVAQALLEAAVALAAAAGATAVEGFPFSGAKRRSGGDVQVGFEPLFAACGFEAVRAPSASRVVMRRELK